MQILRMLGKGIFIILAVLALIWLSVATLGGEALGDLLSGLADAAWWSRDRHRRGT